MYRDIEHVRQFALFVWCINNVVRENIGLPPPTAKIMNYNCQIAGARIVMHEGACITAAILI